MPLYRVAVFVLVSESVIDRGMPARVSMACLQGTHDRRRSADHSMNPLVSKSNRLFPATSWSLLGRAAKPDQYDSAIAEFSDLYYGAISGFISSVVRDPAEAEELTQKFLLTAVLEGQLLQRADRARGAFREYLKQAVRNFLKDDYRHRTRKKRHAPQSDLKPDGLAGGWDAVKALSAPPHDAEIGRASCRERV